jgi:N-acetylated-alpha-linked acidic dipeptidase
MNVISSGLLAGVLLFPSTFLYSASPANDGVAPTPLIAGFRDASGEIATEKKFLAVPEARLAEEHLRVLTKAPHVAGSPEDRATAEYVAQKFRDAGLDTEIVEYKVWFNLPQEVSVDVTAPAGVTMHGPSREHVEGDLYQDDPRIIPAFNGMSPSGDAEAEVVYANYGSPEDFEKLAQMKIDVRGKIVLVRYGGNFRGVKAYVAQQHGAAAVLIYSDPSDDGWKRGDKYPDGPWRPDTAVQRGSIGYMFEYSGDPTTPGIASLPTLEASKRTPPEQATQMPKIPTTPLSYADAWPILQHLDGTESPRDWQGALPFTYHVGPGPVKVRIHLKQDYQYRTIWDVVGRVRGAELPDDWVITGNHRDAWVYGAVDPNSGTAAMLEAVHGVGALLKSGWKPKRTLIFGSWDAEEEGLIGSTEWGEENESALANAVAYFNMDVAVAGSKFAASSVPSLKQFLRDVTKEVPSPQGGSVYDAWKKAAALDNPGPTDSGSTYRPPAAQTKLDVPVGDLGSGSDYTVFLQHLGVPSTDIGSTGPYGVYHSAFDNFQWFKKFGDPTFVYEQEMARVFGVAAIRMADAELLPFDFDEYGKEILAYLDAAKKKAENRFGKQTPSFAGAIEAAKHLEAAGEHALEEERHPPSDPSRLNHALSQAERGFLLPKGLPNRPWYRHAIYAPGQYTGYAAVVIPGVNEAIDRGDVQTTQEQLATLEEALNRVSKTLESTH